MTLIGVLARLALTFREYMRMCTCPTSEASTDALTGLGNRRRLLPTWKSPDCARPERPVAFGLFDLDGFKPYNDTYGTPQETPSWRGWADSCKGRSVNRICVPDGR